MRRAVVAGLVTVVVGYTGAFAVVLTGLRSVGATPAQAASGLAVLCLTMGVATIGMAWRYRMPITIAWSTPGAALLATAGVPDGGWPAAVFAFIVTGVLLVITGLVPWLGRLVARIPTTLAQAMLAGVLVPICLVPVQSVLTSPQVIAPVLLAWLVMLAWKPRWAAATSVGLALVIAVIAVALGPGLGSLPVPGGALVFTLPVPSWSAAVGLALPLWLVTMASQNIPGAAVLGTFGYQAPWRPALVVTGLGTVVGAPFGGHAINYAAISAALAASADAGEEPSGRWLPGLRRGGGDHHGPGVRRAAGASAGRGGGRTARCPRLVAGGRSGTVRGQGVCGGDLPGGGLGNQRSRGRGGLLGSRRRARRSRGDPQGTAGIQKAGRPLACR